MHGSVFLRELLAGITCLEDLAALVGAAGHSPCFQELPADGWPVIPLPRRMALLGRHQGFEWIGMETDGPPEIPAARLARRLERTGRSAAVVALAPANRSLAVTVSLDPRPLLSVELAAPSRLALHCLERLAGAAAGGGLGAAAHLAQALDADRVGRRFFAQFRTTLEACITALPARIPRSDRHTIALLQLTRVLFLYFVQGRGWLDGRATFLTDQVDRSLARREPLHRSLLRPLFFGTLNQPADRRRATARRFGRIPFLNGGLFEPHPLERRWRVDLDDEAWRAAFDDLFERFHFTTTGEDPDTIAPDMLGRVFEGVMDPEERASSGTFYTPTPLVEALVRAGLVGCLDSRLRCGWAGAERRLGDPDGETREVLRSLTVLDPAVGSGAFLLGALQALSEAFREEGYAACRRILASNLYGVDLNPTAVRLTELRLWLALIAADPASDPAEVEPLPNLDAMVRQGDSLLDPLLPGWVPAAHHPAASEARALRFQLHQVRGRDKAATVRALRRVEARLLDASLRAAENAVRAGIDDLMAQASSPTLFGGRRGLPRREAAALAELRRRRRFLWRVRHRLARDQALPWFHFPSQFPEVFGSAGGFDLVIGNPPWVRAESLPAPLRSQLAARYRWWRVRERGRGYAHQPDLAVAFLERAHELAAPGGSLALLLPRKLATAGYAAAARGALTSGTRLQVVADLSADPRAAFDATTYPMALVATRAAPGPDHHCRRGIDPGSAADLPQRHLDGGPWILVPDPIGNALQALREGPRLGDHFRCQLGVKTGLNEVFLDPPGSLEPEVLCWAVRGRDVGAFTASPVCRLLWTHAADGAPLATLPPRARTWLDRHSDRLVRRRDYAGGPVWTLFRVLPSVAPHRVVWADLAPRLEVVALNGPHGDRLIPLNTCYLIAAPDPGVANRLAAWLNCTWVRAAAATVADVASGGFRRFNARVAGSLPLPASVLTDQALEEAGHAGRAGRLAQEDLDAVCSRLLDLPPAARAGLATLVPPGRRHRR